MSRKLFLHVGPSKTGTSAIQSFFREHEPDAILYPETGRWPDGSHHKLVFAHKGKTKYGTVEIPPWEQLLESLVDEISNSSKDILISSEVASPKFVKGLMPLLSEFNLELNLILIVRNPIERAASAYNQGVKDSVVGLNEDPNEYLLNRSNQFRFKPLYEKWGLLNQTIIVIPYKDKLPLIQRFCFAIGISEETVGLEKRANRSMGGAALLAILIANKLLKTEIQRREYFGQLQKNSSFNIWKGESFPFGKAACTEFTSVIKDDIDWIIEKFSFSETNFYAANHEVFSLSEVDIEHIHTQLKQSGLADQNEQLISNTLAPYRNK